METTYTRTTGQKAAEAFGVVAALGLISMTTWRVATAPLDTTATIALGVALCVGVLLADLFSGLVHWVFDRFGTEETPFFGPNFIKAFRFHHKDPLDITLHGFLATNGSTSLATLIPLLLLNLLPIGDGHWSVIFVVTAMVVASVLTILTNQFHKWAHTKTPPAFVAWLQDQGIILGREHHAIHHVWPHESYFCITTGWLNPFMAGIRFWSRGEALARRFGVPMYFDAEQTSGPSIAG
jgi:ubiquitin-conjugating enzyme E2 variant